MLIVASGGHYMERTYQADPLATKSRADCGRAQLEKTIAQRLGAFGEIGENADAPMSALEGSIPRGRQGTSNESTIFTQCLRHRPERAQGRWLRRTRCLESVGVKPERVVIGHSCCWEIRTQR
jgi:hypothetical protein